MLVSGISPFAERLRLITNERGITRSDNYFRPGVASRVVRVLVQRTESISKHLKFAQNTNKIKLSIIELKWNKLKVT